MTFLFVTSGQFGRMAPGELWRTIPRDRLGPESDSDRPAVTPHLPGGLGLKRLAVFAVKVRKIRK